MPVESDWTEDYMFKKWKKKWALLSEEIMEQTTEVW